MQPQKKWIYTLAIGFTVVFFWSVISYWGDWIIYKNIIAAAHRYPSMRLYEPDLLRIKTADTKSYEPGCFDFRINLEELFSRQTGLGISGNRSFEPEIEFSYPTDKGCRECFAYDKKIGQFVIQDINYEQKEPLQKIVGYIGPKGYSANVNPQVGTFSNPFYVHWLRLSPGVMAHIVYDNILRRFYRIEINYAIRKPDSKTTFYIISPDSIKVVEGPQLQIDKTIVDRWKWKRNGYDFSLSWMPPQQRIRKLKPDYSEGQYASADPNNLPDGAYRETFIPFENAPKSFAYKIDFLILCEDGKIDSIDGNTLTVAGCAGYLPQVGFYQQSLSNHPQDLGDYDILGLYDPNDKHLGTAVAAVSRDGLSMQIVFYDDKGNLIKTSLPPCFYSDDNNFSGLSVLTSIPRGPLLITLRYLWENLQPPVLRLLDLPASQWFNPETGYSHLFVRPNSMIGLMKIEFDSFNFWLLWLFLMLPSLVLSLLLATSARIKAAQMGYPALSKDGWFVAILTFGIPAYITFRLMLPKERMITCANCGNLRRVEFENCQSCKRDWQKTKSLTTPPDWSAKDTGK
ncbi:MAG: hypothetical protein FJ263_03555 [Planctomycetes bacterium]|nr:hypothetical protein [Planctomycetota bacterium]